MDIGIEKCISALRLARLSHNEKAVPASKLGLELFSQKYNVPPELSSWLALCNGVNLGAIGILLGTGENGDYSIPEVISFQRLDDQWIPFASDGCGGDYCIHIAKKICCFVAIECEKGGITHVVSSSLWHCLYALIKNTPEMEEDWPFSKSFISQYDPELLRYTEYRMPWDPEL